MKRRWAVLAVIATAMSVGVAAPVGAAEVGATDSFCGITWGSLEKTAHPLKVSQLTNVRGGQHACYDRLVLDFKGKTTGYYVRYEPQVYNIATGALVPLRGGGKILVGAFAPNYDSNGYPTYYPGDPWELVNVSGWQTFRQVAYGGSSNFTTHIGLGVRARLPFRVFHLDGPGAGSRLVIDVAHRW